MVRRPPKGLDHKPNVKKIYKHKVFKSSPISLSSASEKEKMSKITNMELSLIPVSRLQCQKNSSPLYNSFVVWNCFICLPLLLPVLRPSDLFPIKYVCFLFVLLFTNNLRINMISKHLFSSSTSKNLINILLGSQQIPTLCMNKSLAATTTRKKKREEEIFITVRYYKSENRLYSLNTVNFCPGDIHFRGTRGKHLGVAAH